MEYYRICTRVYCAFFLIIGTIAHAGTIPKFAIVPITPTNPTVCPGSVDVVQYYVTNNTKITRTLTVVPQTGIIQDPSGMNACANPFTLKSKESCLLTLNLIGDQLPSSTIGGPVVCKTHGPGDNRPTRFLCSQPTQSDTLDVRGPARDNRKPLFAYIANLGNNTVSRCPITIDGTFCACLDSGNTGVAFNSPEDIDLNTAGDIAYVANLGNSTISRCPINSDGSFGACTDSGNVGATFQGPLALTFNVLGNLAYVTNGLGGTVYKCPVNPDGTFGACVDSGVGAIFSTPLGIALNLAGDIAYVSNSSSDTVSKCSIDVNGDFIVCVDSGAGAIFDSPKDIIVSNDGIDAYVAIQNSVLKCPINPDGTFAICTNSGNTGVPFVGPWGLIQTILGKTIYVANENNDTVSICPVKPDGTFGVCTDSGNSGEAFSGPHGIALGY